MTKRTLLAAALAFVAPLAFAQEKPIAFLGARIIPITGPEIAKGVLVVQKGRIVAVGPEGSTQIPAGAARVDATGKLLMPGLVDSHSHIGSVEGADASAPIQPDVRALDSISGGWGSLSLSSKLISRARPSGVE